MVKAKVKVPFIGAVDANVLVDLNKGSAIASVPFLGVCK
jgi:molybdopterin-binding protein